MSTSVRLGDKSKDQILSGTTFQYPLIIGQLKAPNFHEYKNTSKIDFTQVDLDRDSVIPDLIHPEMSEIPVITAGEKKFTYRPYLMGIDYHVSDHQSNTNDQNVIDDAVYELSVMFDSNTILGTAYNNGLISTRSASGNPYYKNLDAVNMTGDFSAKVKALKEMYKSVAHVFKNSNGARSVTAYWWGSALSELFDTDNPNTDRTVFDVAANVMSSIGIGFVELPSLAIADRYIKRSKSKVLPSANGIVFVANDFVRTDAVILPQFEKSGHNDENEYSWFKMKTGSVAVHPTKEAGIVLQPISFS